MEIHGLHRLQAALAGRYTIERELGHGGMATVYLARDLKHDRPVALKVLRPELGAILGAERFLREIRLTAQLQHPHILTLIDSGEADGFLYYVMPYVEGESLRQRLEREGQLPLDEALRITRAVAAALDFAHRRGVIHRDIKPDNILLHEGEPLVADFGIALAVSVAGRERLTQTGLAVGTPAYTSPEQASAAPKLDGRTDQYSLACIVYEMLAGEPPYTGPTAQAIIAKRLSEPIPHLSTVRQIPPAVDAAVTKALAKAPADRFPSAGAFVAALTGDVTPGTGAVRTMPTRGFRPRWAWLAAAAAVVVAIGVWLSERAAGHPELQDRVMVVPLANRTGDPALEGIGQLISERIVDGVRRAAVVPVAVATLSQPISSDDPEAFARIGRRHEATIVVHGAYYAVGDSVEFRLQLARPPEAAMSIRIAPFRVRRDFVDAMLRIAEDRAVGAVAATVDPVTSDAFRTLSSLPKDLESYRLWREAEEGFQKGRPQQAIHNLQAAWRRDTTFFLLLGRMAWIYVERLRDYRAADSIVRLGEKYADRMGSHELAELRFIAARLHWNPQEYLRWARRLELDHWTATPERARTCLGLPVEALEATKRIGPGLYLAAGDYELRVARLLHLLGRYEEEREQVDRAAATNPRYPWVLESRVRVLAALGRGDEARAVVEQSRGMMGGPEYSDFALVAARELRAHGDSITAREVLDHWIEQSGEAGDDTRRFELASAWYTVGAWDEAARLLDVVAAITPDSLPILGLRGVTAARRGDGRTVTAIQGQLGRPRPYVWGEPLVWRARIAAIQGRKGEAVKLLIDSQREGYCYDLWVHRDMDLEPLRGTPGFEEFIRPKG